jgi:hypothetical protein
MPTFTFNLQGTTPTEIEASDIIQFAAPEGFDSKISVGSYNDTTHVKTSADANKSSGNTPRNNKFISATEVSVNGGATKDLDTMTEGEAALKINFEDEASVITEEASFYAYDGVTPATPPVGVNFRAAEVGDENWTEAEGSGAALALDDHLTPATSHDFFIAVSASPTSVGLKVFAVRAELTYS